MIFRIFSFFGIYESFYDISKLKIDWGMIHDSYDGVGVGASHYFLGTFFKKWHENEKLHAQKWEFWHFVSLTPSPSFHQ